MKKFLSAFLILSLLACPVFAADQWLKDIPDGTEEPGTIDDVMRVNQEAQDRLLNGSKRGLGVNYATASTLTVLPGEIAIPNAAVSVVKYRETTTNTTITWSDIDTGSEENSTQYYLYSTGDTDITGMVFKISKSASLPSGSTYFVKISEFYNNSLGNITEVLSYRQDHGTDYRDLAKGWVSFTGTGTVTINKSYNVSSISDNGVGDYTITWDTSFADAYYVIAGTCRLDTSGATSPNGFINLARVASNPTSGSVRFNVEASGSNSDAAVITIVAFGDRS